MEDKAGIGARATYTSGALHRGLALAVTRPVHRGLALAVTRPVHRAMQVAICRFL